MTVKPTKEELELLLNNNMTRQDIGNLYGKSPSTVSLWIKEYSLKSKRIGGANNIKNLIGCKFGKLTVAELYQIGKHGKEYICECECGNSTIQRGSVLTGGYVISCGCIRSENAKTYGRNNLISYYQNDYSITDIINSAKKHIDERYEKLKIIDVEYDSFKKRILYICQCDCGNVTKQIFADLKNGKVKSCGCYQKEQASTIGSMIGLNNYKNKYHWYFIKNGKIIKCRSGYEVIYANYLIQNNIDFDYEPKCFKLDNGKRYTPDFHILNDNSWVEIKGSFQMNNSHQKEKAELFSETHNLSIFYWNDLVTICNLQLKTYRSYLQRARRLNIKEEKYLAEKMY